MKIVVVSDLHIGNGKGYDIFAGAVELPSMLEVEQPDRLIINGDGVDFLLDDEPIDRLDEARAIAQAEAIVEHSEAVLKAIGAVPEVLIRLGNHDVELALPEVQAVFKRVMGAHVQFVWGDETEPLIRLNGVKILVTHGEHADPNNRLQYRRLNTAPARFRYPFGSQVVKRGLNPLKREQKARFADLIKPDMAGGLLTTAFTYPGATALRVVTELPGLAFEMGRGWISTGATFGGFDEGDDEGDDAAPSERGRILRWLAGARGERFFDLEPTEEEKNEVDRLIEKFGCQAVIMGHTHAARFAGGAQPYVNTGTWIPLIRMPGARDELADWGRFLDDLAADPQLIGVAKKYVTTRFTGAVVTEEKRGIELALVEWKDGERVESRATQITRGRAPAVHVGIPPGACFPFLAAENGAAFAATGARAPAEPPAPAPTPTRRGDFSLGPGHDANRVAHKFWGLIVAESQRAAVADALAPLLGLREAQMGKPVPILVVPDGMADRSGVAQRWMADHWLDIDTWERPEYLLIAGDLDAVPLALHRVLAREAFVGRVAFTRADRTPDTDGYRAYAEKVVRHHDGHAARRPEVLLYQVDDGTRATRLAETELIEPATAWLAGAKRFDAVTHLPSSGFGMPCPDELLDATGVRAPNILLTASHGVAARSDARRLALQGAMCFGREHLRADDLRERVFVPGGLWIYIACFGAGTPSQSAYARWLGEIFPDGREAQRVQATLSERPFIAALPQAALANPNGPLGMIAHVDLAWSYGLVEQVARRIRRDPHHRLSNAIARMGMRGPTDESTSFGLALGEVRRMIDRFSGADADLRTYEERGARAGAWMARNDLEGYILLGDPAVRLPVGVSDTLAG